MRTDTLIALLCLYWALCANRGFLSHAMAGADLGGWSLLGWVLLLALLHFLLLQPLLWRAWARPALAVLAGGAGVGSYFVQQLGAVLDPAMLRNALHTNWPEARELLGGSLLLHVALVALPAWLLIAHVRLRPARGLRATLIALAHWLAALVMALGLLALNFQNLASAMRNDRSLRYQIVPAAPLWSAAKAAVGERAPATVAREPIGLDARPGPSWVGAPPRLLVLVLGETVRAANWGQRQLEDGSLRDTTPALRAATGLLHWPVVQACGTDTETSVPCLFAPVGRRDYDEARIRRQQSLLDVLARAGVRVHWLDNQSGCKGVCGGLGPEQFETLNCDGGRCLDDALFARVPEALARAEREGGVHLLVLHMLGTHGPAYHRRVPEGSAPYQPACAHDDLTRCDRATIVNAYDNALRHQDQLLAGLWQQLRAAGSVQTALWFLPDHGESLGEHGLYLHGLPYALAPREQKEVPMVVGLDPRWAQARTWSEACLAQRALRPASHDHLFHSVLSLLDVQTTLHSPDLDLWSACGPR